jgi:hypothetical protein
MGHARFSVRINHIKSNQIRKQYGSSIEGLPLCFLVGIEIASILYIYPLRNFPPGPAKPRDLSSLMNRIGVCKEERQTCFKS